MISKCAKCQGTLFELQEQAPLGSTFKLQFVQCSTCGIPIGVLEYYSNGAILKGIEQKINNLNSKVDQIEYDVSDIKNRIK